MSSLNIIGEKGRTGSAWKQREWLGRERKGAGDRVEKWRK
jgi:hypothetical protein